MNPVRLRSLLRAVAITLLFWIVIAVAILTRDATWTAGTAAMVTALFIAYQGAQTARAASATEEELRLSRTATAISNQSLVVSQVMAIEAEKRRLDVRAPQLAVRIEEPEWPPFHPRRFQGSVPTQLQGGEVHRLPGAGREHMALQAKGTVVNEGPRVVRVDLHNVHLPLPQPEEGRWAWKEDSSYHIDLKPGEAQPFLVFEPRMIEAWIENSRARLRGEVGPEVIVAEIIANDGFDNGVVDHWRLEVGGYLFEPVAGETDSWVVPQALLGQVPIYATCLPLVRTYYRSKRSNLPLPDLDLPPA